MGVSGHPCCCPISNWLALEGGWEFVSVGKYSVLVGTSEIDHEQVQSPYWLTRTVHEFDCLGRRSLRAHEALALLDAVLLEVRSHESD